MSVIADILNRFRSLWMNSRSSQSVSSTKRIDSLVEPSQHTTQKNVHHLTFWTMSMGVVAALTILGFSMGWLGIQGTPKVPNSSRSPSLSKQLVIHAESQEHPHETLSQSERASSAHAGTDRQPDPSKSAGATVHPLGQTVPHTHPPRQNSQSRGSFPPINLGKSSSSASMAVLEKPARGQKKSLSKRSEPQPITTGATWDNTSSPSEVNSQNRIAHDQAWLMRSSPPVKNGPASSSRVKNNRSEVNLRSDENLKAQKPSMPETRAFQTPSHVDDAERLSKGRSLIKSRFYHEAVEMLDPLVATPPDNWEPWFWMGTAQLGIGHYEKARECFREGLARDETISQLWVQLAVVEQQRGAFSEALEALRQAELLEPTLPHVQLNLAFTLESQGNSNSALQHYRKYLSLTGRNPSHFSIRKKVVDRILHLERS